MFKNMNGADVQNAVLRDPKDGIVMFAKSADGKGGNNIAIIKICKDGSQQSSCTLPAQPSMDKVKFRLQNALKLSLSQRGGSQKKNEIEPQNPTALADEQKARLAGLSAKVARAIAFLKGKETANLTFTEEKKQLSDKAAQIENADESTKATLVADINKILDSVVGKILNSGQNYSLTKNDGFLFNVLYSFSNQSKLDDSYFAEVTKGTFEMGSSDDNPDERMDRLYDEKKHTVTITHTYGMGRYLVNQKLWVDVMGYNNSTFRQQKHCENYVYVNDDLSYCPDLPATNMDSDEAQFFAKAFEGDDSTKSEWKYRLPTENEWEYAARGGQVVFGPDKAKPSYPYPAYVSGDIKSLADYACYEVNSRNKENNGEHQTCPVGEKRGAKPNVLGLYDISGNVWQRTQTWYNSDYPDGPVIGNGLNESSSGSYLVWRGGSWGNYAPYLRLARRGYDFPSASYSYAGFRIVRMRAK